MLRYLPHNRPEDKEERGTTRETDRERERKSGGGSSVALYYAGSFRAAGAMRVAPRIQRASIPHRLMPFFSRITRRRNFGPRAESARAAAAATRRIANNTFSLSRGLGLPRLLRPATEAIKLYSQRNQLWEKERKEERERERDSLREKREVSRIGERQKGTATGKQAKSIARHSKSAKLANIVANEWRDKIRFSSRLSFPGALIQQRSIL